MIQQRYLSYCKANNNTPDEQLILDKLTYPGGCMCGFMFFINQKKQEFKNKYPENINGDYINDRDKFTKFIGEQK